MAKAKTINEIMTDERWQALEKVYSEAPRVVPWDGWRTAALMHLATGLDAKTAEACESNAASALIALTHGARIGLMWGEDCRLVSRGGVVRFHVGPDGRSKLAHRAGIIIRTGAVWDCDLDTFVCDLGDESPVQHRPNLKGRMSSEAVIVAAWASGEWYDANGLRRAKALADAGRLFTAEKHGDAKIWKEHYAKMACNTAITDLWRYLPRSAEMDALTAAVHDEPVEQVVTDPAMAAPSARAITYGAQTVPETQTVAEFEAGDA